jgi:hypothetical protein
MRRLLPLLVFLLTCAPKHQPESTTEPLVNQSTEQFFDYMSGANALSTINGIIRDRMPNLDQERRDRLAETVFEESMSCGLDPLFALAVAEVESRWDHEAVSSTGARGLYQVIPSTWKMEVKRRQLGILEKFNLSHNARIGIGYLCYLSSTFKRPESLLLAYNQGPGGATAIIQGRAEPSSEAQRYAPAVLKSYKKLLASLGLPNDMAHIRQLFRHPESTIYTPLTCEGSPVDRPVKISKKRCTANLCMWR